MHATSFAEELPAPVAEALERGHTVVTANQRAARTLRQAFDRRNRDSGLASWHTASIFPWEMWVTRMWNRLLLRGKVSEILLNSAQEHALWRGIIAADSSLPPGLHSYDSLSELAATAWRLLAQRDALDRTRHSWTTPETRAFQRWSREFERQCHAGHLLPRAGLENRLRYLIEKEDLVLGPVALVGFDELLPAQSAITAAMTSRGVSVEILNLSLTPDETLLTEAPDEAGEIAAAARWARSLLVKNPTSRIAVISTSLQERRSVIDRTFREILAPELQNISNTWQPAPYEFSVGVPLSQLAMVRTAMDLLAWCASPLPFERVSALLVSPLFAMSEAERSSRAKFDAYDLRRARVLRPQISLQWVFDALSKSENRSRMPELSRAVTSMMRSRPGSPDEVRSHTEWTTFIRKWLQDAGWRRGTGEDSTEFQALRRWESTLDLLATLDFDGRLSNFEQIFAELERLLQQTVFAPESHQAPVQVMGPLEASGSTFDALWFLGAGDLDWPVKSTANPLLPWALQRDLGLPGANSGVEEAVARKITARLAASARQVIFSYPKNIGQETQRASGLVRTLPLLKTEISALAPPDQEPEPVLLEEFSDLVPVQPLTELAAAGGVEIIKLQAACPFRAFAEKRLGSSELRELELGLDARELGSVLHRVLEHFWKQVGTQAVLKEMSPQVRQEVLSLSVRHGLQKARAAAGTPWEGAYIDLQETRLMNLLDKWLDIEMNRAPFVVKESEEEIRDAQIGPLRLNLRVDRVDLTDDGEVIIDYKTGAAKAAQWQGDRPDEPQLPLYAVISRMARPDTRLADVAFAQIRAGSEMAFESFLQKAKAKQPVPQKRELSFEDQLEKWQRVLQTLAENFHSGHAEVDPKAYPETCNHCAQRILCRLNPAAYDEDLDEETSVNPGNA